ncbi:MAG: hypothetical protein HY675_20515 [Chloroflexi bacterium]|nr:hypothetical protein [Chloroflexota bacterium]
MKGLTRTHGRYSLVLAVALSLVVACGQLGLGSAPQPKAESAADFFKGKTISLVVPYGAGSTTDSGARIFASSLEEVTGSSVVVTNKAGGGGLDAWNSVYAAKPDGLSLVFGVTGPVPMFQMFEEPGVRYDTAKITWIGSFAWQPSALSIAAALPYKSMDDLRKSEGLIFGGSGKRAGPVLGAGLIIEFFELKGAKIVHGYASPAEIQLAMGRGEVQALISTPGSVRDGVTKGFAKPPFVILDFKRTDAFPDAPTLPEVLKLSSEQERILRVFASIVDQSRVVFATPGIPEDRVVFLRESFDKIMEKPDFLQQIQKFYTPWTGATKGKDLGVEMQKIMAVPKQEITKIDEIVNRYVK